MFVRMMCVFALVVAISCWSAAESTCHTRQMERDNPADVSIASIVAGLRDDPARDETAETL